MLYYKRLFVPDSQVCDHSSDDTLLYRARNVVGAGKTLKMLERQIALHSSSTRAGGYHD